MKKINNKKKRRLSKIVSMLLLILIIVLFILLFAINILSIFYVILALVVTLIMYLFLVKLNFSRKKPKRVIGCVISILFIILTLIIDIYLGNTVDLFSSLKVSHKIETYNVIVLKDSEYKELKDIDNKDVGVKTIKDNPGLEEATKKISKKVDVSYNEYNDIGEVASSLVDEDNEAIILEQAEMDIFREEEPEISEKFRVIHQIEVKLKVKNTSKEVNILKEPFNIYISGVDTYGKINSATRSDVNMVLTVNPVTERIHITWIPRDYYVSINNSTYKDKLTHAGIYGVDTSIRAVENLLGIDVNYYVKVNFTSLIDVVDALGGITVYNDQSFVSQDRIRYNKGNINLDGTKALSFVRERKNVTGGDIGRGKNQIKVLEAMMEKVLSPKLLIKYNSLMNSLDGSFITDIDMKDVTKYIEKEIKKPKNYEFTDFYIEGKNGFDYTYSYKKSKVYVMYQDEESIKEAKNKLNEVLTVE